MHFFGASFLAAAVNSLPGGPFKRRSHVTAFSGVHFVARSAKPPPKIPKFQLRFHLCHCSPHHLEIVPRRDVVNNSLTPHRSKYNSPLKPLELIQVLSALPNTISGISYCHRSGSSDICQLLNASFLTIHAVSHILLHRKLKLVSVTRHFSALQLEIRLELGMYFLISCHLHSLRQLQQKKKRMSSRRRRTRFGQSLAPILSIPYFPPQLDFIRSCNILFFFRPLCLLVLRRFLSFSKFLLPRQFRWRSKRGCLMGVGNFRFSYNCADATFQEWIIFKRHNLTTSGANSIEELLGNGAMADSWSKHRR